MYQPFKIGKNFRITPQGSQLKIDDRIDLIMQRGAFGSGEHETTESCLEVMESLPNIRGARVLDLGSGTGILGIAAMKLGARQTLCVDIEEQAVETAKVNFKLNGLKDGVTHVAGMLQDVDDKDFDIILANIYGDILLDLAETLSAKLKPNGVMLLSGILWEYNFDVRQAYEQQGCTVVTNKMLDEFSSVLLIKSDNR